MERPVNFKQSVDLHMMSNAFISLCGTVTKLCSVTWAHQQEASAAMVQVVPRQPVTVLEPQRAVQLWMPVVLQA